MEQSFLNHFHLVKYYVFQHESLTTAEAYIKSWQTFVMKHIARKVNPIRLWSWQINEKQI